MTPSPIAESTIEYFSRIFEGVSAIALTLTFNPKIKGLNVELAEKALRHYRRLINRVSRKKGFEKRGSLKTLAVRETTIGCGIHYHLMVEVPQTTDPESFAAFCIQQWHRMRWGRETQAKAVTNADEGWIRYCLKPQTKPVYADAIDWTSCSDGRR